MLVADEFAGTLDDDAVAERVESGEPLTVTVDETERRRSRFRTTADDGTDLGVVVARELRDGDVLSADGRPVVVSLEAVEAMVVDFGGVGDPDRAAVTAALELGHAVGNRHWDLAVEGERAYLPLTDTRERMAATVEPHLPDGAAVGYEEVPPTLFDDGDAADHSRGGEHGHSHGHDNGGSGHSHSHDHGDGHSHDHSESGHSRSHGETGHSHGHGGSDHSHGHGVRTVDPDPESGSDRDTGGGEGS